MKFFFLLCLLVSSVAALHVKLVSDEVGNGKTALIKFPKEEGIDYKEIVFEKRKIKLFANPVNKNEYYALVPVSYYEKPGQKQIEVLYTQNGKKRYETIPLKVYNAKYKKETLHVDSSKVRPKLPKVKKRIAKEYSEAMKIYHTVTAKSYLHSKFIVPMQSEITSDFGTARVYNGSHRGYHSGTDFRAQTGTPIVAANDGRIALVKNRFYSGGTVLIDHGEGIYTCYFHMSKFHVKENQLVKKGDVLGLSGKSGRVTGPHLHFSARINGIQVDPLQLISLMNNNLLSQEQRKKQ